MKHVIHCALHTRTHTHTHIHITHIHITHIHIHITHRQHTKIHTHTTYHTDVTLHMVHISHHTTNIHHTPTCALTSMHNVRQAAPVRVKESTIIRARTQMPVARTRARMRARSHACVHATRLAELNVCFCLHNDLRPQTTAFLAQHTTMGTTTTMAAQHNQLQP